MGYPKQSPFRAWFVLANPHPHRGCNEEIVSLLRHGVRGMEQDPPKRTIITLTGLRAPVQAALDLSCFDMSK
jgi:hypothetical protein